MKKQIIIFFMAFLTGISFAYNPPIQSENFFLEAHPEVITGGYSCAGGGIFSCTPASTLINPALGAQEERITVDFGYTAMPGTKDYGDGKYGQAFGAGVIVPTDIAAFGGEIMGLFTPAYDMHLGKSFNVKLTASKQFMESLFIGAALTVGGLWGDVTGSDWFLCADAGAIYNFDRHFKKDTIMKNLRLAVAVTNLGKTYTSAKVMGDDIGRGIDNSWPGFPGFFTLRAGFAAEFVSTEKFKLGLSADVSTPFFTNLIVDAGVQLRFAEFIQINSSWQLNIREAANKCAPWAPTIGIVFKVNTSKGEFAPSLAYKHVGGLENGGKVNMIGVGGVFRIGELDRSGPDIEIE